MSKLEHDAEVKRCTDIIKRCMGESPDDTSTVYTLTTFGRGQTDYVRVFVVDDGSIVELTYHVGKAGGLRQNTQGLAYGGGQYNKGLEAADSLWRVAFGEALDQSHWVEI